MGNKPGEELPLVESITMQRTPKGWVVVVLKSRGDRIVDKEVVCEPQAKVYACEALKIHVVNRFIREVVGGNRAPGEAR